MAENLMGTPTTLIDRTDTYVYIGCTRVYKNIAPAQDEAKWQITRITLVDGKATEIKNAHADNTQQQYFKWTDRTSLNYI